MLLRTLQSVEIAGNSCFSRREETPLRLVHQLGQADLGRVVHQQMDVVRLAVEFDQIDLEVGVPDRNICSRRFRCAAPKTFPCRLVNEHQMGVQDVDDVSSLADIHSLDQ